MERYNVLLSNNEGNQGVIIMPSSSYAQMVRERPSFAHTNTGDFYSELGRRTIAIAIYTCLRGNSGEEADSVILTTPLNIRDKITQLKESNHYVIDGMGGVRLYSPMMDGADNFLQRAHYGAMTLAGILPLFSTEKEGIIQKQVKELEGLMAGARVMQTFLLLRCTNYR